MTLSMIADGTSVSTSQKLWPEEVSVTDCSLSEVLLQGSKQ